MEFGVALFVLTAGAIGVLYLLLLAGDAYARWVRIASAILPFTGVRTGWKADISPHQALAEPDRTKFWDEMERLSRVTAPIPVPITGANWVTPALSVRAKHLRCSGMLRHATLCGVRS
jgi:hypothetical protein